MPETRPVMRADAAWAIQPLGMDDAAKALGISRRTLVDVLKRLPYFEARGSKKVFYPEHIASLRREMHECACRSNGSTDGRTSPAPAPMVRASDALSKLKTLAARRS